MSRGGRQHGFTFLEVLFATIVAVAVLGLSASLAVGTDELTQASHVATRGCSEHRRAHVALADVLRTVAVDSLEGFDEGEATEPFFERIEGVGIHAFETAGRQSLVWRAVDHDVDGVAAPGQVWLVGESEERLLADRVPAGGFGVRQEGRLLVVRLTTYYATDQDHVRHVTSENAVLTRN